MMLHDGGNKMTLSFLGAYMGPVIKAWLSLSLPPPVKVISDGWTDRARAACSRADNKGAGRFLPLGMLA